MDQKYKFTFFKLFHNALTIEALRMKRNLWLATLVFSIFSIAINALAYQEIEVNNGGTIKGKTTLIG